MNELLGRTRDQGLGGAVAGPDRANGRQVNAFDARKVEPVFGWHATALMVGVDATDAAEVVLGNLGVPLIEREFVCASRDPEPFQRNAGHDCALSAANRTIAATDIFKAIDEVDLELHRLAVAGAFYRLHGSLHCALTPELSRTAARNGGVVHVTMQPSREAVSA